MSHFAEIWKKAENGLYFGCERSEDSTVRGADTTYKSKRHLTHVDNNNNGKNMTHHNALRQAKVEENTRPRTVNRSLTKTEARRAQNAISKMLDRATIIDIESEHCTADEQAQLLGVFEPMMKRMAVARLYKAAYKLDKLRDGLDSIKKFVLRIERKLVLRQEQWEGMFEFGNKKLRVLGTLEG